VSTEAGQVHPAISFIDRSGFVVLVQKNKKYHIPLLLEVNAPNALADP
jgi:hypothetical protein